MGVDATKSTWELSKTQVTPVQKLILLSYADRAGESSECWPSNARIEKDTGLNRHTICINKQILIDKGLISYTGEKKGRTKSIDVIRLNYVKHREGKVKEVHVSSGEICTALKSSSGEMPIAKQCGNAHTEPKRIEPKNTTTSASLFSSSTSPQEPSPIDFILAFKDLFPEQPAPIVGVKGAIEPEAKKVIKEFKVQWGGFMVAIELPPNKPLTHKTLNLFLQHLKHKAPGFCTKEYGEQKRRNGFNVILNWVNIYKILRGELF